MHPFPSGVSDITYYAALETDGYAWVYIPGGTTNNRILNKLREDEQKKEEIPSKLDICSGTEIVWRTPWGSLGVHKKASLGDSEEKLEEIRKWMCEYLLKFEKVFNRRLEKIVRDLDNADK